MLKVQRVVRTSHSLDSSRLHAISVFFQTNAIHFILQILKEIHEEHDSLSDHSTALPPVQLETFASSTCVETEPELMQVKCSVSIPFFFYHLSHSVPILFSSGHPPLTDESMEQPHLQLTLPGHQELEAPTVRGNVFSEGKASQVSLFFYFKFSPFAG